MKKNLSKILMIWMIAFACFLSKDGVAKNQYADVHLFNGKNIKGVILDSDSDSIKIKPLPENFAPIDFLMQTNAMSILKEDIKFVSAKSPNTALFSSLFPGCFIHGWGHKYAGDYLTYTILGLAEGTGIILYFISPFAGLSYTEEQSMTSEARIITMRNAGLILFFGSWVYDIIFSPSAANEYNKNIKKEYNLPVSLKSNEKETYLVYRILF